MKKYHFLFGTLIFVSVFATAFASQQDVFTLWGYIGTNGTCVLVEVDCPGTAQTCRRFVDGANRNIYEYTTTPFCGAVGKMD